MAQSRYAYARYHDKARRATTDITLNSINWADVDNALDLTLNDVQIGDEIVAGIDARLNAVAVQVRLDVVTVVGAPTNSFARQGPVETAPGVQGIQAWWTINTAAEKEVGGLSYPYTLTSIDIVDGAATFRLRYSTSAATARVLYASANVPLSWWIMNLGPSQD